MLPSDIIIQFSSVQSLTRVQLLVTLWIAACQTSLSITNSRSLLKSMSIESVMPSSHLILFVPFSSCPQSLPASGSFPMSQLFAWGGQSIGVSASELVLPMNTQGWCPLGWTGWISLQSKGLSRVFSNTTVQKHQFFSFTNIAFYLYKDNSILQICKLKKKNVNFPSISPYFLWYIFLWCALWMLLFHITVGSTVFCFQLNLSNYFSV